MIASVTEMLELPKFDHITISTILFESHDKILFMMSWKKVRTSYYFKISLL